MTSHDENPETHGMLINRETNGAPETLPLESITNSEPEVEIKDGSSLKTDVAKDPEIHRKNIWLTFWMFCSFLAFGLIAGEIGPSFLDLLSLTNSSLTEGSTVITAGSVGYFFGSIGTGLFLQPFSYKFLIFVSLIGSALSNITMPWCPNSILLGLAYSIRSIFNAVLNTVISALCVEIWSQDSGPYMQAICLGYALGALGSPLIVKPFLGPTQTTSIHSLSTVNQTSNSNNSSNITVSIMSAINSSSSQTTEFLSNISISNSSLSKPTIIPKTEIHYAFLIISVITILTAIPFGFHFFKSGTLWKAEKIKKQEEEASRQWKETIIPLLMILLVYMIYCGMEDGLIVYLTTFTTKYLNWKKPDGAMATFVFSLCFASGRIVGIFMLKIFTTNQMLLMDLSLMNICSFVLLWSKSLPILVWIFFGLSGFAMSTIYATGFTWAETYLFKVTSRICSAIAVFSAIGGSLNPIFLGFMMEEYSPRWYLYIILGEGLAFSGLFLALAFFSKSQYWQNKRNLTEDKNRHTCTE